MVDLSMLDRVKFSVIYRKACWLIYFDRSRKKEDLAGRLKKKIVNEFVVLNKHSCPFGC